MSSFKPLDIPTIPLEGTNLIEASAGTGKTYTISHLYLRLILEKQYDVRSILVVTFTDAATKELIERIRSNLAEAYQLCSEDNAAEDDLLQGILANSLKLYPIETIRTLLRKAIIRFDEAAIYTIHGFCKRLLSDYSFETSILFDTELISDQRKLIQEITDDFQRITFSNKPAIFSEIAFKYNLHTAGLIDFAFRFLRMPGARLIPEMTDSTFDKVTLCLEEIIKEWKISGPIIRRILSENGGLKRSQSTYRPDVLEGYLEAIEQLVDNNIRPGVLNAVAMLSQEMLNSSVKKNKSAPDHPFFDLCQQMVVYQRELAIWIKRSFADYLIQELSKRKKELNIHAFDDLISAVHRSLHTSTSKERLLKIVRENYQVALVDEFQDTDAIQYDIFNKIFADHEGLFLIGDPKQSIYSFRGADLFTYFQAAKTVSMENGYTLDTNWRSETGVVKAVNALFSAASNPFVLGKDIPFSESHPADKSIGNQAKLTIEGDQDTNLVFWTLKNKDPRRKDQPLNKEEAARQSIDIVTGEISKLLELSKKGKAKLGNRHIQPSDIAILVLKNKDAQALKDQLTQVNIPAVMTKSGDVFHSPEAQELHLILEAVSAPLRTQSLNTALSTEILGLTGQEILAFLEDDSHREEYEEHISRFSEYNELWKTRGFMRMFRKLLGDYQVRKHLLGLPGGERKLTNVLHLAELIHSKAVSDKPGLNGLLSWLGDQRISEEHQDEHELRLERDDEAVQISTVFKSKGLQYPIVFCPFMWQRSAESKDDMISYHQNGELILDLGSDDQQQTGRDLAQTETLADLVRLLYVALTRAQNRCYLMGGRIGRKPASALDYIFSGGKDLAPQLVSDLMNQISKMDEKAYLETTREYLTGKPVSIRIESDESTAVYPYQPENAAGEKLSCYEYSTQNHWSREWGIASYSGLIAGETFSHHSDDDLLLTDEINDPSLETIDFSKDSFFSFPSGRVAGTCIHSIFEKLDFSDLKPEFVTDIIKQELNRFSLIESAQPSGQENPLPKQAFKMVSRVLSAPLKTKDDTMTLDQITENNKLVELEFHFPITHLSPEKLAKLVDTKGRQADLKNDQLVERLQRLSFKPINGFMHGFIDLIFKQGEKYYIADWKSNNLGTSYSDYHPDKLYLTMLSHFYDLQYYIYTVALDRYLDKRLPDYDYNRHFGGVFYLFVRGMHHEIPGNGVFYDLPAHDLVSSLSKMIR